MNETLRDDIKETMSALEIGGSIEQNRELFYDDDDVVLMLDGVLMGPMTIYGFTDRIGAVNPYVYQLDHTEHNEELEKDRYVVRPEGPVRTEIVSAIEETGGKVERNV